MITPETLEQQSVSTNTSSALTVTTNTTTTVVSDLPVEFTGELKVAAFYPKDQTGPYLSSRGFEGRIFVNACLKPAKKGSTNPGPKVFRDGDSFRYFDFVRKPKCFGGKPIEVSPLIKAGEILGFVVRDKVDNMTDMYGIYVNIVAPTPTKPVEKPAESAPTSGPKIEDVLTATPPAAPAVPATPTVAAPTSPAPQIQEEKPPVSSPDVLAKKKREKKESSRKESPALTKPAAVMFIAGTSDVQKREILRTIAVAKEKTFVGIFDDMGDKVVCTFSGSRPEKVKCSSEHTARIQLIAALDAAEAMPFLLQPDAVDAAASKKVYATFVYRESRANNAGLIIEDEKGDKGGAVVGLTQCLTFGCQPVVSIGRKAGKLDPFKVGICDITKFEGIGKHAAKEVKSLEDLQSAVCGKK